MVGHCFRHISHPLVALMWEQDRERHAPVGLGRRRKRAACHERMRRVVGIFVAYTLPATGLVNRVGEQGQDIRRQDSREMSGRRR